MTKMEKESLRLKTKPCFNIDLIKFTLFRKRLYKLNFSLNDIKIKSNWFIEKGVYSKIKHDGFLLYLNLYRYHVPNQEQVTFATSIKQLKKDTGFPMDETLELFKRLIKYKVISCSVRWDRHNDNDFLIVEAIDAPKTERVEVKGKWIDKPITKNDIYTNVDMKLMQHYLNIGFDGREMGFYCLIMSLSHNPEEKAWKTINGMAEILGLSNDKVHKMIQQLNRNYLMVSVLRKNGHIIVDGKKKTKYRFEHKICKNIEKMSLFREGWMKEAIEKNVLKWDKKKSRKGNKNNPIDIPDAVDEDAVFEDQSIQDADVEEIDNWNIDEDVQIDIEDEFEPFGSPSENDEFDAIEIPKGMSPFGVSNSLVYEIDNSSKLYDDVLFLKFLMEKYPDEAKNHLRHYKERSVYFNEYCQLFDTIVY